MKTNGRNGITLIALVITVIVLLILAGTAITLALDGGGLFAHTNNAVARWNAAIAEEEEKTNEVWNILNTLNGKSPTPTVTPERITTATLLSSTDMSYTMVSNLDFDWINVIGDLNIPAIYAFQKSPTTPENPTTDNTKVVISTSTSEYPVYVWIGKRENSSIENLDGEDINVVFDTIYWWSEADKVYLNEDCSYFFSGAMFLSDISGLSTVDTSNVTNMSNMFADCVRLTDLSALAGWDTSNVTDMSGMFFNCNGFSDASALNSWNISNVQNFDRMFGARTYYSTFTYPNWNGTWSEGTFTPAN